MITQLQRLFASVATQVKPEDLFLQKESWVYFTKEWPDTWKWAKGKLFRVSDEPIIVNYAASYILPASDYKDVDLSNSTSGLKLYPQDEGVLYQCAVGFKLGDYLTHIYVPSTTKWVYHLAESSMYPDVADAAKKYLGAKWPSDSPANAPLLFLYFIKDGPAFYLTPYVLEDVAYEKCSLEFTINKCKLEQVPSPTEDQIKKSKKIAYYTELTGF